MASLALSGMAGARASPLIAATPISRADAANRCCRRKAIALVSLTSGSLFTIDLSLSDGERAEAHSSLAGRSTPDAMSDGAASLRRSGPTSVVGPGSPCRPSRVSETANYDAGPPAAVAGALRAHPARGRQLNPSTACFAGALRLVPCWSCSQQSAPSEGWLCVASYSRKRYHMQIHA